MWDVSCIAYYLLFVIFNISLGQFHILLCLYINWNEINLSYGNFCKLCLSVNGLILCTVQGSRWYIKALTLTILTEQQQKTHKARATSDDCSSSWQFSECIELNMWCEKYVSR